MRRRSTVTVDRRCVLHERARVLNAAQTSGASRGAFRTPQEVATLPALDRRPSPPRSRRDPRPWPYRRLPPQASRAAGVATIALLAVTILILVTGAKLARQDAGHVGVVRNGGPLDNRQIR